MTIGMRRIVEAAIVYSALEELIANGYYLNSTMYKHELYALHAPKV